METPQKAITVSLDAGQRLATVHWADGDLDKYPFVWLRDSCRCKTCWSPSACHRLILLSEFDTKVAPCEARININGLDVTFTWPDGHLSCFNTNWLRERSFKIGKHVDIEDEPIVEWDHEFQTHIPTFDYNAIMSDDQEMLKFLETFRKYGLMVLKNMAAATSTVDFGQEIGFLKPTQYGYEGFHVRQKPDAINLAYTSVPIDAHVDLPSIKYVPEIQMLHCIQQATPGNGGENGFADGFNVARILKEKYPRQYKILTTQRIAFLDKGHEDYEFHYRHSEPTICLNDKGEPIKIRFFNCGRESKLDMSVEEVQPFFDALKLFQTLLQQGSVYYKMCEGDMALFHNVRVTHARNEFATTEERHLKGAYMDWDIIFSKIRVLREKLSRN